MSDRKVSGRVVVDAAPDEVFDLLADPARHAEIDASDSVRGPVDAPPRLAYGCRFRMRMHRYGIRYRITNTVVEFEVNRRIAWRHWARHVWRWELEPVGDGRTAVTETFDWAPAPLGFLYPRLRYPEQNRKDIDATLARLRRRFERKEQPA